MVRRPPSSRRARTSAIARTRLIDDVVSQALREGVRQLVILGAGFDCRIYRLSGVNSVAAFEVDHPATLGNFLAHQAVAETPRAADFFLFTVGLG